ncbi:Uma2 family endonuclease [Sulfuricystis multivorans]|uniref:Uma2 family endonuclease n=1 Tax=Sulfuricystis multivorans TaxID=2211108 RepID=UPI000F843AE1|nr:Uma2 family endonuclease [Sulfuricystis multivorans]
MLSRKLEVISPEEYLRFEAQSPVRHEYVNGQIFAMTGASIRHNVIALNIAASLRSHLKASPCRVMIEGVKLHVARENAYYYPDVMVSCDPKLEKLTANDMVVDQPTVIVEVLSESTAGIDRREKMSAYRKLASLKEYVLVEQDRRHVEVFRRVGDVGWEQIVLDNDDELDLVSLEFRLPLAEIYEGTGL